MLKRFNVRGKSLRAFNGSWQKQLLEATATSEASQVLSRFEHEQTDAI